MTEPMFTGDLAFLSNFDQTPFYCELVQQDVKSAEHAFNALKSRTPSEVQWVLDAETPGEAKGRGRRVTLIPQWDTGMRMMIMQNILLDKFHVPELRRKLIATGDLKLVETNHWHDQYWGSCFCAGHVGVPGVNMLGEILMGIRTVKGVEEG